LVRAIGPDGVTLQRRESECHAPAAYEVDEVLARSPRWLADRGGLWAFDPVRATVSRYDLERLDREWTVAPAAGRTLVDIAADGRHGAWALVRDDAEGAWMVHIDCVGRVRETVETRCTIASPE